MHTNNGEESCTMPCEHAYELMRNGLEAVLPSLETFARTAKSVPAKRKLMMQIKQVKEALNAAEQASTLQAHQDRA
jgi:hypothetical protein